MPHSKQWRNKWKPPTFDEKGMTPWMWRVIHPEGLIIEKYVDIGSFTLIVATHGVTIFEGAEIGSHCALYSENSEDDTRGPIQIGRYARIGAHTTILPEVEIGSGAVIGAYSLVKSYIPPNALAYGIPCRVKYRLLKSDADT